MDTPILGGHIIQTTPIQHLDIFSLAIMEPFPGPANSRVWFFCPPWNQSTLDLVLLDNTLHGFVHSLGK